MHHFHHTLELVEHVHRLTPTQARAVLRTIPEDHRVAPPGPRQTIHDRLAAAVVANATAAGRSQAVILELQADLVGLHLPA